MSDATPCPTCGHVIEDKPEGWTRTDHVRVVPDGEEMVTTGVVPVGGLFPRMERVSLTSRFIPRFRYERMWMRTWAETEWRAES